MPPYSSASSTAAAAAAVANRCTVIPSSSSSSSYTFHILVPSNRYIHTIKSNGGGRWWWATRSRQSDHHLHRFITSSASSSSSSNGNSNKQQQQQQQQQYHQQQQYQQQQQHYQYQQPPPQYQQQYQPQYQQQQQSPVQSGFINVDVMYLGNRVATIPMSIDEIAAETKRQEQAEANNNNNSNAPPNAAAEANAAPNAAAANQQEQEQQANTNSSGNASAEEGGKQQQQQPHIFTSTLPYVPPWAGVPVQHFGSVFATAGAPLNTSHGLLEGPKLYGRTIFAVANYAVRGIKKGFEKIFRLQKSSEAERKKREQASLAVMSREREVAPQLAHFDFNNLGLGLVVKLQRSTFDKFPTANYICNIRIQLTPIALYNGLYTEAYGQITGEAFRVEKLPPGMHYAQHYAGGGHMYGQPPFYQHAPPPPPPQQSHQQSQQQRSRLTRRSNNRPIENVNAIRANASGGSASRARSARDDPKWERLSTLTEASRKLNEQNWMHLEQQEALRQQQSSFEKEEVVGHQHVASMTSEAGSVAVDNDCENNAASATVENEQQLQQQRQKELDQQVKQAEVKQQNMFAYRNSRRTARGNMMSNMNNSSFMLFELDNDEVVAPPTASSAAPPVPPHNAAKPE